MLEIRSQLGTRLVPTWQIFVGARQWTRCTCPDLMCFSKPTASVNRSRAANGRGGIVQRRQNRANRTGHEPDMGRILSFLDQNLII